MRRVCRQIITRSSIVRRLLWGSNTIQAPCLDQPDVHYINMPVNPDLQRERGRASFSLERLTWMLDGGKDRTQRRQQLEAVVARDPTGIFDNNNNSYLHRTDRHVRGLAKHVRLVELCRSLGIGNECGGEITRSKDFPLMLAALGDDLPTSLHWVMFIPNIVSLCDEEQQKQWLPVRKKMAKGATLRRCRLSYLCLSS